MVDQPERVSDFTLAVPERRLVALVRDLVIDYTLHNGQPPTLGWILNQLGQR